MARQLWIRISEAFDRLGYIEEGFSLILIQRSECLSHGFMAVMTSASVLFLDFDGVMHPQEPTKSNVGFFCQLPVLETLLLQCVGLKVVVSSSWREIMGIKELRELFPDSVRQRVIGRTPVNLPESLIPDGLRGYPREAQCTTWMRRRATAVGLPPASERWVALDDQPWLFTPFCKHLVVVDSATGLTNESALLVSEWYRTL
jgi:hypothetical protein